MVTTSVVVSSIGAEEGAAGVGAHGAVQLCSVELRLRRI